MVPTSSTLQYPQQPTHVPQATMLPGGIASGQAVPGHLNQPGPLPQQYLGTQLLNQQPVGLGSAAVPLGGPQMPRTSSVGNIPQIAQAAGQHTGGTVGPNMPQAHLPQPASLTHQTYPNMVQTQLPHTLGMHPQPVPYHDPSQTALQGQPTMEMFQHAQQPRLVTAIDDAAKIASVLANKPHLQSDLSRTPSPGDQQQGAQKPPEQIQPVVQAQHVPINVATQPQSGIVGQQIISQPMGIQSQQITNLQAQQQQQLLDGSVPASSVSTTVGASQAIVPGSEAVYSAPAAKPLVPPHIRQVMAMDIRPRAGSEPKTVHHSTRREESPSKTNRQEQMQPMPHRLHTTLDPHVKRTQSLKERTGSLAVVTQDSGFIGNQCIPQASPKPQRRQTVDGTMSTGIQQAIQQFHGIQGTQLPLTVGSHVPVFTPPMQQMPTAGPTGSLQQVPHAGSVMPPNGASVPGLVDTSSAAASIGSPYVVQQQHAVTASVLSAQHMAGSVQSVQAPAPVPSAQPQQLTQPVQQQQLPQQSIPSQQPANQTQ